MIGNQLYFFRALPFGLSTAPRIFTQIMKWPLHVLHLKNIQIIAYLDDLLIWSPSKNQTNSATNTATGLLQELGFLLNFKKSSTTPTQKFEWLGISWFTPSTTWSIPEEKRLSIQQEASRLFKSKVCTFPITKNAIL